MLQQPCLFSCMAGSPSTCCSVTLGRLWVHRNAAQDGARSPPGTPGAEAGIRIPGLQPAISDVQRQTTSAGRVTGAPCWLICGQQSLGSLGQRYRHQVLLKKEKEEKWGRPEEKWEAGAGGRTRARRRRAAGTQTRGRPAEPQLKSESEESPQDEELELLPKVS